MKQLFNLLFGTKPQPVPDLDTILGGIRKNITDLAARRQENNRVIDIHLEEIKILDEQKNSLQARNTEISRENERVARIETKFIELIA